jgi:hypothetical protein
MNLVENPDSKKRWIQNGQIIVDGKMVNELDIVLRIGSKLVYHHLSWRDPIAPCKLYVMFEDDHLVIFCTTTFWVIKI